MRDASRSQKMRNRRPTHSRDRERGWSFDVVLYSPCLANCLRARLHKKMSLRTFRATFGNLSEVERLDVRNLEGATVGWGASYRVKSLTDVVHSRQPVSAVRRALMISSFQRCGRAAARSIAIVCAGLLLVAQTVGVAHFHDPVSRDRVVAAQPATDQGLCPVCQLALHSPGSVTAATTIGRGPAIAETIFIATPIRFVSLVFSEARVRAPPVSI